MARVVAHARWSSHVNAVNPSREMRAWLTDTVSLTQKLITHSRQFRVQCLRQQRAVCLADEFSVAGLANRCCVQERDVLLCCDARPVVFAHTIVPLTATVSDWPFFSTLGERSLGTTLFGDPLVERGALQFARLGAAHSLVRRAQSAIDEEIAVPLYARRCLYRRKKAILLVTEVFLPAVASIGRLAQCTALLQSATK